jgi:hypothetical protein
MPPAVVLLGRRAYERHGAGRRRRANRRRAAPAGAPVAAIATDGAQAAA